MNNQELMYYIGQDMVLSHVFLGVYARDTLPPINRKPAALIANIDTSYERGRHWIAMYFDIDNSVYYFDSYGLPPIFPNFNNYMSKYATLKHINTKRLQSTYSKVCGIYCLYFLYYKVRHVSLYKMFVGFSNSNYVFNDKLICRFFRNKFYVKALLHNKLCKCLPVN